MADSFFLFCFAHVLIAVGMVETGACSPHRYTCLFLITLCCFSALRSPFLNSLPGDAELLYNTGFILHAANFLCVHRLMPPTNDSRPYSWAFYQIFDSRWGLRLKPAFQQTPPSRLKLLIVRLVDSIWLAAALCILSRYRLHILPADLLDVPDGFLTRLHAVSAREFVIRTYLYATSFYSAYASLRLAHAVLTVIAMLWGSDPNCWPPLYGSIADAYTMRRFYSYAQSSSYFPCS